MTEIKIPAGTWVIDEAHSSIGFTVRHMMISKVRGNFGQFSGVTKILEENNPLSAEVSVSVLASSITTNEKNRDAHLKSADFFDTDNFTEATFTSTKIEKDGKDLLVHGDLTIKGVTKNETFVVSFSDVITDMEGNKKAAAEATTTIKRSDYGLTWNTALETGGVLVSEEVVITAEIQAMLVDSE